MSEHLTAEHGDVAHVALITFTTAEELVEYRTRRNLPCPILVDSQRTVYGDYGFGRARFLDVWGWQAIQRYWQILRPSGPGHRSDLRATAEDTRQLGGDMVIAPDGRLTWGHWSRRSTDRPSVDDIVRAVTSAIRTTEHPGD